MYNMQLYASSDDNVGQRAGIATSHGAQRAEALEALNDLVHVFGEDSSKSVGLQDHSVQGWRCPEGELQLTAS